MFGLIKEKASSELKSGIPTRQIPAKAHFLKVTIVTNIRQLSIIGPLYLKLHGQLLLLWKTLL